jgi:hypothetical protein
MSYEGRLPQTNFGGDSDFQPLLRCLHHLGSGFFYGDTKVKYTIKAKPTKYRGVLFRSRLEAKWAAFFDNLKWHWEYEPCEFNGWFPDFAIYGKTETIHVEVKPIVRFCQETSDKIDASGCNSSVLLIGQTCPINRGQSFSNNTVQLGWLREQYGPLTSDFQWGDAELGTWDDEIGYCNPEQGWNDPISGKYGKFYRTDITNFIDECWGDACNKTQWKKQQ